MFSTEITLLGVSFLFTLLITDLVLCTVCYAFSPNIDEILLNNPSINIFVFGDFYIHHKDWLTYSGGTDRPGELSNNSGS